MTPIGWDLTTAVVDLKLDPARSVAVDVLFGMKGPRTLMVTPATDPGMRDAAHALLAADGQKVVVINDSPGFVAQRVVAQIVNIGCGVAQRAIATPADIDKGTKLGLGYPFGPLEWGDRIGAERVLHILERLQAFYGEPRYRPSPWLKRRVALGCLLVLQKAGLNQLARCSKRQRRGRIRVPPTGYSKTDGALLKTLEWQAPWLALTMWPVALTQTKEKEGTQGAGQAAVGSLNRVPSGVTAKGLKEQSRLKAFHSKVQAGLQRK